MKTIWQDEIRNAFKDAKSLSDFLDFELEEIPQYPIFIPQHFASKIRHSKALQKEFLPNTDEKQLNGLMDPIGDEVYSQGGQLIHRYKNRLLFAPTTKCPINCRYCFRKNELFENDEIFKADFEKTLNYLEKHPEVNEIIFTGGDPLFLSNQKIDKYLEAFSKISHIDFIRLHTRFPIIIPSRLDSEFKEIIKRHQKHFKKIIFVVHTNHADEIDDEVEEAIKNFEGIWLSQTVLLKGVNDNKADLKNLFYKLDELNIRPYYLHHPDLVRGGMHFYLSLEEGRKLVHSLRDELPGWLLPQYVLDVPGGHGKTTALNPEGFAYNGKLLDRKGELKDINL